MMRKDDLALSLSLGGVPDAHHGRSLPLQLNLMPSAAAGPSPSPFLALHKAPAAAPLWNDLLASTPCSERRIAPEVFPGDPARSFLKGIDVNRAPAGDRVADDEEEAGVSSPNSTVSSVVSGGGGHGGKRGEREDLHLPGHRPNSSSIGDENELGRASPRGISDEEDGGEGSRKKLRLSKEQSAVLEESFKEHNTLNPKQKLALAKQLNLRPRQVEVWFQNRRARTKLKQTEVDCEFLKRCCENLTEENRRLQKEVQELRALKLSPQLYMHMTPPTTLTMCPSCERVAVSSASSPNRAATSTSSGAAAAGLVAGTPPAPSASAAPLADRSNVSGGSCLGHHRQQQQQRQQLHPGHHNPTPRQFLPAQPRPIPVAAAGVANAGGHSFPWAPTPLRSAAFVDARDHVTHGRSDVTKTGMV